MTTWTYIGAATAERRAALESPRPFVELLTTLKQTMKFACFHRELKQRDDSYARADFCIDVGHSLFDAFFNAATGYRGAHFDSPEIGVAANHRLIAELAPILVTWALTEHPELDRPWLEESLSLPTAKAWLAEDAAALCPACVGGWSASYVSDLPPDGASGRWIYYPSPRGQMDRSRLF
jgi:hypothetical protein